MKSGKVFLGLLAGLAAGTVLGILFAPDKGTKTRKKILDKGEDYADAMKEKFDKLTESLNEKYQNTKHAIEEFVSKEKKELKNGLKN